MMHLILAGRVDLLRQLPLIVWEPKEFSAACALLDVPTIVWMMDECSAPTSECNGLPISTALACGRKDVLVELVQRKPTEFLMETACAVAQFGDEDDFRLCIPANQVSMNLFYVFVFQHRRFEAMDWIRRRGFDVSMDMTISMLEFVTAGDLCHFPVNGLMVREVWPRSSPGQLVWYLRNVALENDVRLKIVRSLWKTLLRWI